MDDELRKLTHRVHDELGDDAYDGAAWRAAARAKASAPAVQSSGTDAGVPRRGDRDVPSSSSIISSDRALQPRSKELRP